MYWFLYACLCLLSACGRPPTATRGPADEVVIETVPLLEIPRTDAGASEGPAVCPAAMDFRGGFPLAHELQVHREGALPSCDDPQRFLPRFESTPIFQGFGDGSAHWSGQTLDAVLRADGQTTETSVRVGHWWQGRHRWQLSESFETIECSAPHYSCVRGGFKAGKCPGPPPLECAPVSRVTLASFDGVAIAVDNLWVTDPHPRTPLINNLLLYHHLVHETGAWLATTTHIFHLADPQRIVRFEQDAADPVVRLACDYRGVYGVTRQGRRVSVDDNGVHDSNDRDPIFCGHVVQAPPHRFIDFVHASATSSTTFWGYGTLRDRPSGTNIALYSFWDGARYHDYAAGMHPDLASSPTTRRIELDSSSTQQQLVLNGGVLEVHDVNGSETRFQFPSGPGAVWSSVGHASFVYASELDGPASGRFAHWTSAGMCAAAIFRDSPIPVSACRGTEDFSEIGAGAYILRFHPSEHRLLDAWRFVSEHGAQVGAVSERYVLATVDGQSYYIERSSNRAWESNRMPDRLFADGSLGSYAYHLRDRGEMQDPCLESWNPTARLVTPVGRESFESVASMTPGLGVLLLRR